MRYYSLKIKLDSEAYKKLLEHYIYFVEHDFLRLATESTVAYLALRHAIADRTVEEIAKILKEKCWWMKHRVSTRVDGETKAKLEEVARRLMAPQSYIASKLTCVSLKTLSPEDLLSQYFNDVL